MKPRAHWYFVVKKNVQRQPPNNVHAIRAVLTETSTLRGVKNLREAAKENAVSPKPTRLLWFTSLEKLHKAHYMLTYMWA